APCKCLEKSFPAGIPHPPVVPSTMRPEELIPDGLSRPSPTRRPGKAVANKTAWKGRRQQDGLERPSYEISSRQPAVMCPAYFSQGDSYGSEVTRVPRLPR